MKIISEFSRDVRTNKPKPGSYEWWYFDAISKNGYSIVIIFYDGNPFSRRYIQELKRNRKTRAGQFPAISISVYKDGEPVFYSFEEFEATSAWFSEKKPEGRAGKNRFTGKKVKNTIEYTLQLHQTVPNGDTVKGTLTFSGSEPNLPQMDDQDENQKDDHIWNLILPKCIVDGTLIVNGYHQEKIDFSGTGYHDHNTGSEPMKDSFGEWYWGRYHTKTAAFIYYLICEKGVWEKRAWLIEDDGNVFSVEEQIEPGPEELNLFGLANARSVTFKGSGIEVFLQKKLVTDDGPFYRRMEGDTIIKRGGGLEQAVGISEYIRPSRIYNKVFWPLVNMRIKYPGKAHWVQKKPRLYRWTW
jgi:carotenoid 1,2-hydratase